MGNDIIRAISTEKFRATPTGLQLPKDKVPYEEWEEYGHSLRRVEGALQWVIGDWLRYGEFAYGEKYTQASSIWPDSGISALMEYQRIANAYPNRERSIRIDWTLYRIAATTKKKLRRQLLEEAESKEWTVKELKAEVRRHQIEDIKEADIQVAEGLYSAISCDPPWPYDRANHKQPWETYDRAGRRAASPYPEMSLLEIAANAPPAADDSLLFLWTTHAFMRDAYTLLDLWEFKPKTVITWVKDQMGLGVWLRSKSEFCIMAVKGKPKVALVSQTTVVEGPLREHSRKPDEFYEMVDSLVPNEYRKLDMYSRESREGWDQYGNEADKFQ